MFSIIPESEQVEPGRCCWKFYSPNPRSKLSQLERVALGHVPLDFEYSKDRDSISSLGYLCQCLTILIETCILPWDLSQGLWCTGIVAPVDAGNHAPLRTTIIAEYTKSDSGRLSGLSCALFCTNCYIWGLYSKVSSYPGLFLALVDEVFEKKVKSTLRSRMLQRSLEAARTGNEGLL